MPTPTAFPVPAAVDGALRAAGYVADRAETTADCAGYSRYGLPAGHPGARLPGAGDVYAFAVVDDQGLTAYVHDGQLAGAPAGPYPHADSDVCADGHGHLSVSLTVALGGQGPPRAATHARTAADLDPAEATTALRLLDEAVAAALRAGSHAT